VELPPFQSLLDAHGRDVHRFLVATVGAEHADDVYQETWIAALRAYPRLREDANLRGWVLRIAHNKAIDHFRSRRRAPVAVGEAIESAAGAGPDAAPLLDATDAGGLWARVGGLPGKQRAALALRFITDAGYPEISLALDCSEDAARRSVHEGLKRLRRELA
jgi:RNA polymerase sigma factor (sigma-70 family)